MDIRALRRKFPPIVKKTGEIHAIVETPQGSRNKFTFEPQAQVFQLGFAMPAGFEFPFEFAFVPGTLGEDGDPLDLLVLMDAPTFVGCLVKCRLVGVIKAVQRMKDGTEERNDRLIAVPVASRRHQRIRSLEELPEELLLEMEHFLVSYNQLRDKQFVPQGRFGPERALEVVKRGVASAKRGTAQR